MEYRHLGNSGMLVSEIAYGNWVTHGSQLDPDSATACVHAALDAGITTFDTADAYADTRAEAVLGAALQGQRREGLEICTKAYFPTGPGPNDRGLSRKHLMESIEGSLRRLRTEYVDVYQAHRYDYETPLDETMQAFADIVRSGKAHYIGISEWRADEIRAAVELANELKIKIVSNQPQYSLLWRVMEPEIQPACEELGLSQIVWSPLAQGVLTGKYLPDQLPAPGTRATDPSEGSGAISHWLQPEILRRVQQILPLAQDADLSLAELALAWVLRNPNVSAAIVGGSKPEQLKQNAQASGVKLAEDLVVRIDEILEPVVERDPSRIDVFEKRP